MHYRNGREAKENDPVIARDFDTIYAGRIHSLEPGSDTCNAQLADVKPGYVNTMCVTLSDCLHAEDAARELLPKRES